ncbi:NADH-quinone oxidoreductase subunit N, partial [bacterium CG17_big_fil_post_rev_8_21_14_2_50_64_8]
MNDLAIPDFGREIAALLPFLIVAGGGLLVMVTDALVKTLRKDHLSYLVLLVLLSVIVVQTTSGTPEGPVLNGLLLLGNFSRFFTYLFVVIGVLTTIFATGIFDRDGNYRPEFYPLLLFAILGMMVLAAANDLLTVYLGLETMSLATYVLAGGVRGNAPSSEAGFKYLMLGGFSSAFFLMGVAFVYGACGGTGFDQIAAALHSGSAPMPFLTLGTGLMLVGFGFKVAMVPFHMWTPDVYDGAPAYVTGFMATAIKAAGFAILLRFVLLTEPMLAFAWYPVLTVLAVLTMSLGNIVALVQGNIKRMLAWSSIAHAGYLLLGIVAILAPALGGPEMMARAKGIVEEGGAALLFYLVGYALMNLAAFGIINVMGTEPGVDGDQISRYAGLSRRQPVAAATLAVAMLSLAGIPPMVGFMAKFYIFSVVVKAGLIPLAIIGVINSLISVYYYLRVIVVMYMHDTAEDSYQGTEWVSVAAAGLLAFLIIYLGV